MADDDSDKKKFDPEKNILKIMTELENGLNMAAEKLKTKREEIEKKGLEETVKDTADKIKAGSQALMEQAQEDAKKLRKNIEEMLKDL